MNTESLKHLVFLGRKVSAEASTVSYDTSYQIRQEYPVYSDMCKCTSEPQSGMNCLKYSLCKNLEIQHKYAEFLRFDYCDLLQYLQWESTGKEPYVQNNKYTDFQGFGTV